MNKLFDHSLYKRLVTGIILLIIFFLSFFYYPSLFSILIFCVLLIILITEWPKLINPKDYKFWLLMPIYPILTFILIILLNTDKYRSLLFNMFILVFIFDSASYIFGKLFGKHKLCSKISPGKTMEGFFGGLISVFLTMLILLKSNCNIFNIILYSIIFSILALIGDLFESSLKRNAKIKDSGNLLPGHGGFLDRFDSIMFLTIIVYIFKDYLIKYFQ